METWAEMTNSEEFTSDRLKMKITTSTGISEIILNEGIYNMQNNLTETQNKFY